MKYRRYVLLLTIAIMFLWGGYGSMADTTNETNTTNLTFENTAGSNSDVEYPENGLQAASGVDYGIGAQGYAQSGSISTGFSGTSTEARGSDENPAATMSFSDKSMVSGFIKNFMKSFHYESGIDL